LLVRTLVVILILGASFPTAVSFAFPEPMQTVTSTSFTYSPLSTFTTQSTGQQNLLQDSFTVQPTSAQGGCWYTYETFTGSAGPITGSVTSNNPIDFEISSIADYNAWAVPSSTVTAATATTTYYTVRDCMGPNNPIVRLPQVTSYNFNANLPSTGEYVAIANNKSPQNSAQVTWSIQAALVSTQTVTSYTAIAQPAPSTQTSIQTTTQTITQTSNQPSSPFAIPGFPATAIAVGIVLGLAVIALRRKIRTQFK
jgi:hypothetical protein